MTKAIQRTVAQSIARKREPIATLRGELEDLNDYLDLVEARVNDRDKPRLTHTEVKKTLRFEIEQIVPRKAATVKQRDKNAAHRSSSVKK